MSMYGDSNPGSLVLSNFGPSCTKQSFASECDINNIVSRWEKSGVACDFNARVGQFLDVSNVPDFHSANNFVLSAKELFMQLPAAVRESFDHSPAKFLDFAGNPKNFDKLCEMGLATKPAPTGAAPSGSASAPEGAEGGSAAPASSTASTEASKAP